MKSVAELRRLQRRVLAALLQPLGRGDGLAARTRDGGSMRRLVEGIVRPNDRLTAVGRLEIYARSYWFRVIDCVYDDCPGLRALLGDEKFGRLVRAYLAKYPSRSFTLRDLCARLPRFVGEEPRWTAPHTELARAIARFEWAQTVAFDGEARRRVTAAEIGRVAPGRLRLGLQPYLTVLALDWPVDDYVLAVKRREALRSEASNAVERSARAETLVRVRRPRRQRVYVVVHRHEQQLYYKRIGVAEHRILRALEAGKSVATALGRAGRAVTAEQVQGWFATWMELGWICARK